MENFEVSWEIVAVYELREIVRYISEQGARAAAIKLKEKIELYADKLSFSPYRVFFDKKLGFRKCSVGEYIILFRIVEDTDPKQVVITHVVHGRRNLRKLIR